MKEQTIRVGDTMAKELEEQAQREGRTVDGVIWWAVRKHLDASQKEREEWAAQLENGFLS